MNLDLEPGCLPGNSEDSGDLDLGMPGQNRFDRADREAFVDRRRECARVGSHASSAHPPLPKCNIMLRLITTRVGVLRLRAQVVGRAVVVKRWAVEWAFEIRQ